MLVGLLIIMTAPQIVILARIGSPQIVGLPMIIVMTASDSDFSENRFASDSGSTDDNSNDGASDSDFSENRFASDSGSTDDNSNDGASDSGSTTNNESPITSTEGNSDALPTGPTVINGTQNEQMQGADFENTILDIHNQERAAVNVPALSWSNRLSLQCTELG